MTTLKPALRALGWHKSADQRNRVKDLSRAGAFGSGETLTDAEAQAVLDQVDFPSGGHAMLWLAEASQAHPELDFIAERMRRDGGVVLEKRLKIEEQVREITDGLAALKPEMIISDGSYQFRAQADANGVTVENRQRETAWNDFLHGDPLLVHQQKDGSLHIVDGHHRLEFAKRLRAEGKGPEYIAAKIIREEDSYSAKDAKMIGAFINMTHGHANVADAARALKEAEGADVHRDLLPPLDLTKHNLAAADSLKHADEKSLETAAFVEKSTNEAAKNLTGAVARLLAERQSSCERGLQI